MHWPGPYNGEEPTHDEEANAVEQELAEHAIRPGAAGEQVKELAQLVQATGRETYLATGGNGDHVFDDELMRQVREVLIDEARKEGADPQVERELAQLDVVDASTWQALRRAAAAA